jgi:hypothetical protein
VGRGYASGVPSSTNPPGAPPLEASSARPNVGHERSTPVPPNEKRIDLRPAPQLDPSKQGGGVRNLRSRTAILRSARPASAPPRAN